MRWAIHFPVFSLLSLHQGKHIIHASALGKDNSALLFTGLNGVGKSTLAAYLATVYDFQFLSDNFALFDDQRIFPFPERLRLSQQSFEILGRDNPINSPTIYGKIQVSPPPVSQDGYSPLFCFLLRKGASPRISRLSPDVVPQLKESLDHYLKEYPAYSYLGVWLGLRGDGLEAGREDSAVFKCPWFIVDIHHTGNLSKTAEEILECTSTFRI